LIPFIISLTQIYFQVQFPSVISTLTSLPHSLYILIYTWLLYPSCHNYSFQMHFSVHLIITSKCICKVVLATGPIPRFGSGSGSDPEPDRCNGFSPKPWHFKSTILAPIRYLSSDRIVTWSVRRLCSFSPSFTSRCHICNRTNIRWVAIENPHFSAELSPSFTAIQRILLQSQIWQREEKEGLILHNLRTDHVTIRSELRYLFGAKVEGTVIWNRGPVPTLPRTQCVHLFSG